MTIRERVKKMAEEIAALNLTIEKEGFNGLYFEGSRDKDVVIIRVSGSGAPKENVVSSSRFLIDAGYNVLCLGYYLWGELGDALSEIPLDYVEKAIDWIKHYTKNDKIKIAMTGLSQGASYTLAAAALFPEISCIAVASPFEYVMEGTTPSFKRTHHSNYIFHGKELPYTEWKILNWGLPRLFFRIVRDKKYGISRMMRYAYDKNGVDEISRIHIEDMHADVLMLASKDDDCWPSDEAMNRMERLLKAKNYPYYLETHLYEKGCHNMGGDMMMEGKTGRKMSRLMRAWADHPVECAECIKDSKQRILDFLTRCCK